MIQHLLFYKFIKHSYVKILLVGILGGTEMNVLFQHQTLGDLMAGFFDGTLPLKELQKYDDTGIGTFHTFDGELTMIDGVIYQIKDTGIVSIADGDMTTPYAAIAHFKPDMHYHIDRPITLKKLRSIITEMVRSINVFSVIRIDGHFPFVQTRAVSPQIKPYPRLIEAASNQSEFETYDISGTAIGILTPELFDGVSKGGFHCHFISDDRSFGGHIMDYIVDDATIQIQTIDAITQNFATNHQDFMQNKVDYTNLAEEMEIAEG